MADPARRALIDVPALVKQIAPEVPEWTAVSLERIFTSMEPAGSLAGRLETLERLARWLAEARPLELPATAPVTGRTRAARLWLLVEVLKRSGPWREQLGRLFSAVLIESSALTLFARTGLPAELRILSEAVDRLARKLLPQPPDDTDLAALSHRLFPATGRAAWLEEAPPALVVELGALLLAGERGTAAVERLVDHAADAVALIAVRVATIGLDDDVRARSGDTALRASPFLELPRVCDQILEARLAPESAARTAARERCLDLVRRCKEHLAQAMGRLEEGSVSVDLVFRLELLDRLLERILFLQDIVDDRAPERAQRVLRFYKELVRDGIRDRSLVELAKGNSRLLARKVIERAGETGEQYSTTTRAEWHAMVTSAAGGGLLAAGTTALKLAIGFARPAFFFEWLFTGISYAGSFLTMQALGLTLASKQPSMTAAALAGALEQGGKGGVDKLVDQIAATSRSQLAAVLGNVGVVVPAAVMFNLLALVMTGSAFLDEETARSIVESLHPWQSATLLYAMVTGGLLWLSSILAGWLENWTVYRRLPEAIARHRTLNRLFGTRRCEAWARAFSKNISGVGGNTALGFLFAGVPVFGKFFGLPLDVRHVTLSAGALALAGSALGPVAVLTPGFALAAAAIGCIGLLNFSVSFALALAVALRARNVALADVVVLGQAVLARLWRSPASFLYPPSEEPAPAEASPELAGPEEPTAAPPPALEAAAPSPEVARAAAAPPGVAAPRAQTTIVLDQVMPAPVAPLTPEVLARVEEASPRARRDTIDFLDAGITPPERADDS
jgi:site-specific recombinase